MKNEASKNATLKVMPQLGNKDTSKDDTREETTTALVSPMETPSKNDIDRMNARKKHQRRTAGEIDRAFICPYDGCTKYFGSEGSQNLHIKIKHNGGSKTDREKMAKMLVEAFAEDKLTNEIIDSVDLNLPPGVITKMAQKRGLVDKVNEVELLETINRRLAPKFREIICSGQYLNDKGLA